MAVNTITGQESCGGPHAHSFRDLWSVASVFLSRADIFRFRRVSEFVDADIFECVFSLIVHLVVPVCFGFTD